MRHDAASPPAGFAPCAAGRLRRPTEEVFRVVPLKDGQHLKEDQTVYVNVDNCTQAVEIR